VRRFDARLNDHFARLTSQLSAWNGRQCDALREVELLGDSMIREIARLQSQIASLEANLVEAANAPSTLAAEADANRLSPREASSRAA